MTTHAVPARLRRAYTHRCLQLSFFASLALLSAGSALAQQAVPARETDSLGVVLARLTGPDLPRLPAASEFKRGDRTIAATERVTGNVAAN